MTDIDIHSANRVPLPNGQWADLRPVQDIRERARRPIRAKTMQLLADASFTSTIQGAIADGITAQTISDEDKRRIGASVSPEMMTVLEDVQDLLLVAVVRGWSFLDERDQPVPVSTEGVLDLPGPALDELKRIVAPYQSALNPNLAEPNPDPASPTAPSGG
ncbi:hypothetical protein [Kitasatospora sp. CB02891]|uniref:hypothetical protein n=1 Tax=Kitasatospora sp. CB02891 TaxID=2020329 RepID=UPI000C275A47|nr:hypothetical protein [Kitasatospora sp. CB02891]PJN22422.1 hypothetical protein CG736_28325 [Kitasatospora sp. CB02891]